jgi:hypothetical protein
VAPGIQWLINYGAVLTPVISSFVSGVLANVVSSRRLMIAWSLISVIGCVCGMASNDPAIAAIVQLIFGFYAGNAVTCMLTYTSLATSMSNRSLIMLAGYFNVSSLFPAVVTGLQVGINALLQGRAPSGTMTCGVMLAGLVLSSALFVALPERPLEFALGHLQKDTDIATIGSVLRRLIDVRGVSRSLVVVMVAHFLLINAAMFGFQVYSMLATMTMFAIPDTNVQLIFAVVSLGVSALALSTLLVLIRVGITDRVLILASGLALIIGYGLVITWGVVSPVRWLIGSAIITVADNAVIALGTSSFTKLVSPTLLGAWIGVMIATNSLAQLIGSVWVSPQADTPYEITLALVGASLLLMIAVYRFLAPTLYSPWSGGGLPVPTERSAGAAAAAAVGLDSERSALVSLKTYGGGSGPASEFSSADGLASDSMSSRRTEVNYHTLD